MKILALDPGDRWVGSAISDELGITCRPLQTIELKDLNSFIEDIVSKENIESIVIGHPKTLKGKESEQTKKIQLLKNKLEEKFDSIEWILWDERLSSKRAQLLLAKKFRSKEGKKREHSVAAAFILQGYLDYKAFSNS